MYNQATSANYPTLDLDVSAMRLDEAPTFDMRGSTTVDNTQNKALYSQLSQSYSAAATNFGLAGMNEAAASATASSNIYSGVSAAIPAQTTLPINMEVQISGRDNILSQLNMQYPL